MIEFCSILTFTTGKAIKYLSRNIKDIKFNIPFNITLTRFPSSTAFHFQY